MHAAPDRLRRPRRLPTVAASLLVAVALLSGCVGERDPSGYSDSVGEHFVAGCVDARLGSEAPKAELADVTSNCQCLYDELSDKETGISFDEFKSAQSKIQKDPTDPGNTIDQLIPAWDDVVAACTTGPGAG